MQRKIAVIKYTEKGKREDRRKGDSSWIMYAANAEDVKQDGEGLQTLRTLARNMVFLMKSIALGKEQFGLPEKEEGICTNFI